MMAQGVYAIPKVEFNAADRADEHHADRRVPRRGPPEAAAMLERIIDIAADELGIDPVEMRRRNFIPPDEFPYTTVTARELRQSASTPRRSTRRCASPATTSCAREQAERRRARRHACSSASACSAYVEVTAGGAVRGVRRR